MHRLQLFDKLTYQQISNACIFLSKIKLICEVEYKLIGNSLHLKSQNHGFELQYVLSPDKRICNQDCKSQFCDYFLESVFLYLRSKKFAKYSGSLAYTLCHNSTLKSVIMLLGEPQIKSKVMIECIWDSLGIGVNFLGNNWKNQDLLIQYLYLYAPQKNSKTCSLCRKSITEIQQKFNCQNCEIIQYCSNQCYQKHYLLHLTYCQDVD